MQVLFKNQLWCIPFNPNVPDMDGCSPVNFLGVFCFRPGSVKQEEGMVIISSNKNPCYTVESVKKMVVILLCFIRSGSSSWKEEGRLPPSLSLPPASDDVLWDCDCCWAGWDWWICCEGWLWMCCLLSLFWWANSPFWEGVDASWVFFTLKNTGEGGLFSMGLNSQMERTVLGLKHHNM